MVILRENQALHVDLVDIAHVRQDATELAIYHPRVRKIWVYHYGSLAQFARAHQQRARRLRLRLLEEIGSASDSPTLFRHGHIWHRTLVLHQEDVSQWFVVHCLCTVVDSQFFSPRCVGVTFDLVPARIAHAHFVQHLDSAGRGQIADHVVLFQYSLNHRRRVLGLQADAQISYHYLDSCSDLPLSI